MCATHVTIPYVVFKCVKHIENTGMSIKVGYFSKITIFQMLKLNMECFSLKLKFNDFILFEFNDF